MEVTNYLLGYKNLKIIQDNTMFNFSLDSVLLPNFITLNKNIKNILDIGTGNGPIPLILSTKTKAKIMGVELQKDVSVLAQKSVLINHKEDQIKIINADINQLKNELESDSFDVITCNPPFFPLKDTSKLNDSDYKTIARHEIKLNLEQVLVIARKLLKNDKWIDNYLTILEKEIKSNYRNEKIKTLYIGGGTPSTLNLKQLNKLFKILEIFNLTEDAEITMEFNVNDLTKEKLTFLKDKINRLSIGVESFNEENLNILERPKVNKENIILAKKYFKNISIDLIYGFNNDKYLKDDLEEILKLDIPHISLYSLILEENTKLYINNYHNISNDSTSEEYINKVLTSNGYKQYEISNYAKEGYESKHNLVYWNNDNYYGFGLGASGYIDNIRYDNTRSLNKYLNGNYILEKHKLDKKETIQNEFILGFRKIEGININKFKEKYNLNPLDIAIVKKQLKNNLLILDNNYLKINPKYLYVSNEILLEYL